MKITILDGYTENPGDLSWGGFGKLGKLTAYDRTANSMEIVERIGDARMVYTSKTPITRETIESCRSLKYTGILATSHNVVDVRTIKEAGVIVTNIPTYGSDAVSQFAIALLLELCHHIGEHAECVKNGDQTNNPDWCFWSHLLIELAGKTMGIIRFGRIGQGTGGIAQALGVRVLVYDTRKNRSSESATCRYIEIDELLAASDVISLCCPLSPETRGIINRESVAKVRGGVMVINNSRGQLVVEEDSRDALNSGEMAGTVVDAASTEPIRIDNPLFVANDCAVAPHISWISKESRQRLMNIAVDNLKAYTNGRSVNIINEQPKLLARGHGTQKWGSGFRT